MNQREQDMRVSLMHAYIAKHPMPSAAEIVQSVDTLMASVTSEPKATPKKRAPRR